MIWPHEAFLSLVCAFSNRQTIFFVLHGYGMGYVEQALLDWRELGYFVEVGGHSDPPEGFRA